MLSATRMVMLGTLIAVVCVALVGTLSAVPSESQKTTPPEDQTYVGVKECASCHFKAFAAWQKTGHSRAFRPLTEKYQKDPKCLKCHTTGYGEPTGYQDASGTDLQGITCESCHGPGSKHTEICKAFGEKKLSEEEKRIAKQSIWEILPKNVCIECHTVLAHKESETPEELRRRH
ncbi:MAG: hypothetical protein JXB62_01520 [Pirellulales bacterium]|nr:hypothetical protein [Pirellulales bacterium]